MAALIRTDGSVEEVQPADGKCFTLGELQAFVGGYIELVSYDLRDPGNVAICNEEGKLEALPLNLTATRMARLARFGDYAVGNWLFCKRTDLESEDEREE